MLISLATCAAVRSDQSTIPKTDKHRRLSWWWTELYFNQRLSNQQIGLSLIGSTGRPNTFFKSVSSCFVRARWCSFSTPLRCLLLEISLFRNNLSVITVFIQATLQNRSACVQYVTIIPGWLNITAFLSDHRAWEYDRSWRLHLNHDLRHEQVVGDQLQLSEEEQPFFQEKGPVPGQAGGGEGGGHLPVWRPGRRWAGAAAVERQGS